MYSPLLQLFVLNNSSPGRVLRAGFLLLVLALTCFALSPAARAVTPAPDGGYPGNNTAEGDSALFSLTSGVDNTAIGYHALYYSTDGGGNTAIGRSALQANSGGNNTAIGSAALENTGGNNNTATGFGALGAGSGDENTA